MRYVVDCRYKSSLTTSVGKVSLTRIQPFLYVEAPTGAPVSLVHKRARKAILANEPTAIDIVCTIRG